jgi:hypothetical protein
LSIPISKPKKCDEDYKKWCGEYYDAKKLCSVAKKEYPVALKEETGDKSIAFDHLVSNAAW